MRHSERGSRFTRLRRRGCNIILIVCRTVRQQTVWMRRRHFWTYMRKWAHHLFVQNRDDFVAQNSACFVFSPIYLFPPETLEFILVEVCFWMLEGGSTNLDIAMFATKVLLATVKRTTGMVGLPVIPNARAVLTELYDKTLENIQVLGVSVISSCFRRSPRIRNTERTSRRLPNTEETSWRRMKM